MNKQTTIDDFLDTAIREVFVTLQGKRGPNSDGCIYAKGVTEDGCEAFVYPHRDHETWQLHVIDRIGLKVKVSLGSPGRNGVIKTRLVPFESQPADVQKIVRAKQKALAQSVEDKQPRHKPKPRQETPKPTRVVKRDSARRRAQKHAKTQGLKLGEKDRKFYILTSSGRLQKSDLTLEQAMKAVGFKLKPHEQLEGNDG